VIKNNKKFNLFLLGLLIINLIQSYFTPIISDEAYYWGWAQNLDWGYFDHPPMVAFIIKLSSFFFTGTLGVRFITILLNLLTAKIVWELIPKKNKEHKNSELIFFTILLSLPFFNLYGFITTPDAPLLCFSALFLLAIKKIEEKDNLLNILFLGLAAALLIYSKYFGGIVIFLIVLFKPNLLKKKAIYFAGIFSVILLIPYLYWMYNNDFITLNYHLFQRKSIGDFNSKFIFGYILGTIGVLNPALILLLIYQIFKKKIIKTNDNKFMIRLFVGYLLFFLIYSFRSWIEAHWVAFAIIPMSILLYNLCVLNEAFYKKVKYIGIVSIALIFSLRIIIMLNLPIKTEFHSQKENYYKAIDKIANGRTVLFINSYQKASKYSFYIGKKSFSINDIYYRKNQYDLWDFENQVKNKKVLIIGDGLSNFKDSLKLKNDETIKYEKINKFRLLGKLKAKIKNPSKILYNQKLEKINFQIYDPYSYGLDLKSKEYPYKIAINIEKNRKNIVIPLRDINVNTIKSHQNTFLNASYKINNIPPGAYKYSIVIKGKYLYYRQISDISKVDIKDPTQK